MAKKRQWNYKTIQQALDGENPVVQIGYSPAEQRHKPGDVWTDVSGDTWEQRQGYKVNVNNQADSIRELVKKRCSVCNKDIDCFGDKVDNKIFSKTGKCFDCLSIEELELKLTGKYERYEDLKILKNKLSRAEEMKKNIVESIEYLKKDNCKIEMVTSRGDIVTWTGAQNKHLLKTANKDLIELSDIIKELKDSIKTLEKTK